MVGFVGECVGAGCVRSCLLRKKKEFVWKIFFLFKPLKFFKFLFIKFIEPLEEMKRRL